MPLKNDDLFALAAMRVQLNEMKNGQQASVSDGLRDTYLHLLRYGQDMSLRIIDFSNPPLSPDDALALGIAAGAPDDAAVTGNEATGMYNVQWQDTTYEPAARSPYAFFLNRQPTGGGL